MLAYDEEFLYIGAQLLRGPNAFTTARRASRPTSPARAMLDLADHDRVELLIDVDRDYATFYRLAIDHRGWTGESCWHDTSWNPTWFVASGGDEDAWTAEAAIPLAELAVEPPGPKTTWAVGVQRIVPGVGFQSWSHPAAPEVVPEGFGLLDFQP